MGSFFQGLPKEKLQIITHQLRLNTHHIGTYTIHIHIHHKPHTYNTTPDTQNAQEML